MTVQPVAEDQCLAALRYLGTPPPDAGWAAEDVALVSRVESNGAPAGLRVVPVLARLSWTGRVCRSYDRENSRWVYWLPEDE